MDPAELVPVVEAARDRFLTDLRSLVNVDCGSFTVEGVNRVAAFCEERLREGGWDVVRMPHVQAPGEQELGDCVVGTLRGGLTPEDGGSRFLLIGHMDTVFPEGTVAARPFRVDGDRAYGPGVCDMKAGLLAGFTAIEALRLLSWDRFAELTFVCNPDEEVGSPFSTDIIRKAAQGADVALVLECARETGAVVSARKGVSGGPVEIVGRSAHAGVEPERGRSAIHAAALTIVELERLNGRWPGVALNVGSIEGGIRPNVVAERCRFEIDLRAPDAGSFDAAKREVERIVEASPLETVGAIRWYGEHRPMERTPATARLFEQARAVAASIGFELPEAATGGASDANTTAAMGIPTLDGLGPVGGAPHSDREWLDLTSIVPRVSMLAGLIARLTG